MTGRVLTQTTATTAALVVIILNITSIYREHF